MNVLPSVENPVTMHGNLFCVNSIYRASTAHRSKQAVRVATRYAPPLSSPVGAPARRAPLSRRNVAVVSHAQYVFTVTAAPASRVKAAVSKAAWRPWPLTFWPWKWCPSQVWRGLPLCQFWSSYMPLCSRHRPDVRHRRQIEVRRQTDKRQTKASLNAPAF